LQFSSHFLAFITVHFTFIENGNELATELLKQNQPCFWSVSMVLSQHLLDGLCSISLCVVIIMCHPLKQKV